MVHGSRFKGGKRVFSPSSACPASAGSNAAVFAAAFLLLLGLLQTAVQAQNITWTNAGSGLWADAGNWTNTLSLNSAPSNNPSVNITIPGTRTVTINAATPSANLTVTNLSLWSGGVTTLVLSSNSTPLNVLGTLTVGGWDGVNGTGAGVLVVDGGRLVTTNGISYLGSSPGAGTATVLGGTWLGSDVRVGWGGHGKLNLAGGTNVFSTAVYIAYTSPGEVLLNGGQLVTTNSAGNNAVYVGYYQGVGSMTASNGTWLANNVTVGTAAGSKGLMNIAGGSNVFSGALSIGSTAAATGAVVMSGGYLSTPSISLGSNATTFGLGSFLLSNGGVLEANTLVSGLNGSGVFTNQAGGVLQFTTAAPTLTTNTIGSIVVSNAVISYRGVAAANIYNSQVSNITFLGNNTFQLNSSTNAVVTSYTFGTNNGESYQNLTLVNGNPLWQGSALTVGSGGQLLLSNANASILSVLTNLGAITVVNANAAYSSNVVLGAGSTYTARAGSNSFNAGVTLQSGAALTLDAFSTLNGAATVAAGGAIALTNGTFSLNNSVTNNGLLNVQNLGILNFAGNASTPQGSGTARVDAGGTLSFTNGAYTFGNTLTNNGLLNVQNLGILNFAGNAPAPQGSGAARVDAGGTLSFTNGAYTFGNTLTNAGTVQVVNGGLTWLNSVLLNGGSYLSSGATNVFNNTLTINSNAAVSLTGGQLMTTNSTVYVGNSGVGSMTVTNATWLANQVTVGGNSGSQGTLALAGGTNVFSSTTIIGSAANATGTVLLAGGQLVTTNAAAFYLGNSGIGSMTVSNGTWLANQVSVGVNSGSQGTLTLAGGTNLLTFSTINLVVGGAANTTGTVLMTGGQLVTTNSTGNNQVFLGNGGGSGTMTVSNGTWLGDMLFLGAFNAGSKGTLNIAGGTSTFNAAQGLTVGSAANATGAVLMTGGQLVTPGSYNIVGGSGVGTITVTNGTWQAGWVSVGYGAGSMGTLNIAGGSNVFSSILYVGRLAGATGAIAMSGGYLSVPSIYLGTNATTTGVGSFLLGSGGVLQANTLVSGYNGSGVFTNQSGGVLQFTTATPTITANSANSIVVTNATIAFKGVANAAVGSVTNNAAGLTVQTDSRLRLDGSTNATGLANFALGGAGNYAQLELVGANSLWQSTNLTVGANGAVIANASARVSVLGTYQNLGSSSFSNLYTVASGSRYQSWGGSINQFVGGLTIASGGGLDVTNGQSVIGGTITNAGQMTVFNAQAIYNGNVVNQGAYVSDPSTNTFNGNFTVGPTATVVAAANDVYAFGGDFTMQSTNRAFNMSTAIAYFGNTNYGITTGMTNHTLSLAGSGAVDKGSNWLDHTQLATNFSIGTLTIASGNRLTLTGSAGTNALYVGVLDLSAWSTNVSALTNTLQAALSLDINLYYDKYAPNNAYLQGVEFGLWGGGGLLIPIPEPSTAGLILGSALLSAWLLRRKRE